MRKETLLPLDWLVSSILVLGIGEILTQLVLVREFLSVFYGNELVIGLLLANWLLISGIGSYVGRKVSKIADKQRVIIILHVLIALLLPAAIYVIRNLYNFAFIRGEMVGVTQIFITAFLILLPICFITGFSLPLFSVLYSKKQHPGQIGRVYFFDSLSNIIGGVVFSFFLIYFLNAFQIALLVLILNLAFAAAISLKCRRFSFAALSAVLIVAAIVFSFLFNIELVSMERQYAGQNVVMVKDSVYGKFVVTSLAAQLNFFENSVLLFSTDTPELSEEKVHYAMLQHPEPKRVLLISGGISGTVDELLKYKTTIDYVELDPVILDIGKEYLFYPTDRRVNVYNTDPRLFVRTSSQSYDAVILDSAPPSTAESNRLYTEEFFADIKRILEPGAVVGLGLVSGAEYLNEETKLLDSSVYNALKRNFKNVLVLPGDTAYFVASDAPLSYGVYDNVSRVPTVFVRKEYISERLDKSRIDRFYSSISGISVTNHDFRPAAYYYHLLYWLRQFEVNYYLFIAVVLAFLVFVLWRISRVGFAVLSAGFAGISLELIVLIGFQVLYGNLYSRIGIIITSFMLGLAIGAFCATKYVGRLPKRSVAFISFALAAYSLILPLVLFLLKSITGSFFVSVITNIFFPLMTIIIGALVGALFPVASKLKFKEAGETSGTFFFYDYAGACIGAVLVSVLLVPLLGIFWTCVIIAAVSLVATLANLRR
jgi:spermidine synthase